LSRRQQEEARLAEIEAADSRFGAGSPWTGGSHGAALSEEEAESLALAIRLQQEEDDAALRAVRFRLFSGGHAPLPSDSAPAVFF
jgi:hypothetical protein